MLGSGGYGGNPFGTNVSGLGSNPYYQLSLMASQGRYNPEMFAQQLSGQRGLGGWQEGLPFWPGTEPQQGGQGGPGMPMMPQFGGLPSILPQAQNQPPQQPRRTGYSLGDTGGGLGPQPTQKLWNTPGTMPLGSPATGGQSGQFRSGSSGAQPGPMMPGGSGAGGSFWNGFGVAGVAPTAYGQPLSTANSGPQGGNDNATSFANGQPRGSGGQQPPVDTRNMNPFANRSGFSGGTAPGGGPSQAAGPAGTGIHGDSAGVPAPRPASPGGMPGQSPGPFGGGPSQAMPNQPGSTIGGAGGSAIGSFMGGGQSPVGLRYDPTPRPPAPGVFSPSAPNATGGPYHPGNQLPSGQRNPYIGLPFEGGFSPQMGGGMMPSGGGQGMPPGQGGLWANPPQAPQQPQNPFAQPFNGQPDPQGNPSAGMPGMPGGQQGSQGGGLVNPNRLPPSVPQQFPGDRYDYGPNGQIYGYTDYNGNYVALNDWNPNQPPPWLQQGSTPSPQPGPQQKPPGGQPPPEGPQASPQGTPSGGLADLYNMPPPPGGPQGGDPWAQFMPMLQGLFGQQSPGGGQQPMPQMQPAPPPYQPPSTLLADNGWQVQQPQQSGGGMPFGNPTSMGNIYNQGQTDAALGALSGLSGQLPQTAGAPNYAGQQGNFSDLLRSFGNLNAGTMNDLIATGNAGQRLASGEEAVRQQLGSSGFLTQLLQSLLGNQSGYNSTLSGMLSPMIG